MLFNHWHPPPLGWIKINFDGALRRNNSAGVGWVVRDHKGSFLLAFGNSLQHWDAAQTELHAVKSIKFVKRDWMSEALGVLIEGDNLNIIYLLQKDIKSWKVSNAIDDSLDFLLDFKHVIFSFTNRLGNKLANLCSNLVVDGSFVWEDLQGTSIPSSFLNCLKEECETLEVP
ncbi:hypothetical protein MA16_Dca013106 [Dendrobium catenatum]|uniref:RNase H type-1 domain-containing protein n=1 Tax=Dendrobium catenatum TaxID=906689 RepID=A0A2I0WD48_9ASPA|nr:hypothetical protein MA16_Dca013106 [Dendrobium catenatum]